MADETGISWTDHTFNPWWGCTKIAPGCDNCYAATFDKRTGGDYWNPHNKPRRTSEANWRKVHKWNKLAEQEGRRHRVFCGSMMDWCDNQVPDTWRYDLFWLIRETPHLDWQLLTKRAARIQDCLPDDWGYWECCYDNVWLGVTVENVQYGLSRAEALQAIPAKVRFLSCEPLIAPIDNAFPYLFHGIDWVIVGGESGPGCRPMETAWAESILNHCHEIDLPVWFKQHGGNTKDKGGCEIFGREIKQWPRGAAL